MLYRKKPVLIEAVRYTGKNLPEIRNFANGCGGVSVKDGELYIHTLEGDFHALAGDYIIKGVLGEVYPCKPCIFWKTYEEVSE